MGDRDPGEARYRAFLSYSHKDAAAAGRLHRRLEAYRVPRRLAGRETARGPVPSRLWPIFRDREELPAATDLSETVREALAQSGALIILCSPHAAASLWVAEEIRVFRELHPDRPILAAILEGDPPACFPDLLRAMGDGHEPLATDLRRDRDGERLGLLKLVAGITGLGLDDLVQRDATRRVRRVMAVTAGALAAMLVLAVMTVVALNARYEAERQRTEAEGLIEFMLTDLRQALQEVGRLDLMSNVNQRALAFYEIQGALEELPDDSLERRARVLGALGEDYENFGKPQHAFDLYHSAYRVTARLLARAPEDPERILAHAGSENRLALVAINLNQLGEATQRLDRARRLLASIAAWGQQRTLWLRFAAFEEGNRCVAMRRRGQGEAALAFCRRAVALSERRRRLHPDDARASYDLVFHLFWLADGEQRAGQVAAARRMQARYLAVIDAMVAQNPANMLWREQQMEIYDGHAQHLRAQGDVAAAGQFSRRACAISAMLTERDPRNAGWAMHQRRLCQASEGRR